MILDVFVLFLVLYSVNKSLKNGDFCVLNDVRLIFWYNQG